MIEQHQATYLRDCWDKDLVIRIRVEVKWVSVVSEFHYHLDSLAVGLDCFAFAILVGL